MFLHTTATGQREHDCAIHLGWRELLPKWDLGAEPTAMALIYPDSTWEDIEDLYWDVYQLWRLPRRGQCEVAKECPCKEILNSIKEHLWLKWPSAQLEGEWRQLLTDVPLSDPHTEFPATNCSVYEEFTAVKQDSYEGRMALVRDAHWQALMAVAILEERMEWMSHSLSQQCSSSCWCSGSHRCRRSRSKRRSPGDFPLQGTWSQNGRLPGNFLPQWHCSRVGPVSQSYQAKALGDLCQREGTLANRRESGKWCQNR